MGAGEFDQLRGCVDGILNLQSSVRQKVRQTVSTCQPLKDDFSPDQILQKPTGGEKVV